MASIIDVAKEAQVSIATVSYVLSKKKFVSEEFTKRVWAAVEKLNYKTNHLASGLRNRKTRAIGVVLQNIRNVFFVQLLSGLEEKLQAADYSLVFFDSNYDIEKEKETMIKLRNQWMDGIVVYSCISEKNKARYAEFLATKCTEKRIPLVSIDRNFNHPDLALVTTANRKGAYEAVKHLIQVGRKYILHISGRSDWDISRLRQHGYSDAMRDHGLAENIAIRNGNFRPIDGYEICRELLRKHMRFDAVFAANDQMAIGCIKAIKEMGLSVPEDIAIAGYDNIFVSTLVDPSLTTVNVPRYAMGVAAAELLCGLIAGDGEKERILQTNLIVRQSTDVRGERGWDLYGW